jgi:hypothetical protein
MNQFEKNDDRTPLHRELSPQRVNKRAIIIAIVLFALLVAGMFTFAFLKKSELEEEALLNELPQPAGEVEYASITRIDATHYYIDGLHTLVGEIQMPTPCDLLEASATVMESYPEQIAVSFNVINTAESCDQIITPQRFKVSAPASDEAGFSATFMERPVELNLIPAAPGELPEDFELFIKG